MSRATLEFQVFQVPTGLKVFNSQVIYLISLTKILGQRSLVSKTFHFQKKLSFNKFVTQEIASHRFRENNNEQVGTELCQAQLKLVSSFYSASDLKMI